MVAVSEANEADEANKAIATDATNVTNKADLANEVADANVANRANEASLADEADDAVEPDAANEADSADEAADAAEITKANKAEANEAADEADAEADEADKANEDVEKVSKITVHLCCCWQPFSLTKYCAIFSKDKGYLCPIANNNQLGGGAIGIDFVIVFDETIVIVEIVSANEAIVIDRAIAVNRANTNICRSLLIDGIAIVLYLVFSLTKYSVIFTEVEGDFEKNNNQLGTVKIARSVKIWSKSCSLKKKCNNKLEREAAIHYCCDCWTFEVTKQQKTWGFNNQLK
jgi:hypothetical protein